MTGAERVRFAVGGALMLALVTFGDARPAPTATTPPRVRVRMVFDANFGDAVAREYERLLPDIQVERTIAIGSVATVAAIQHDHADLGFAFADVAYLGYLRASRQPSIAPIQVLGIAALQLVPMHVLVRAGLRAQRIQDLANYRVGVGTALSSQALLADLLFKAYGLGPEVVQPDRRADLLAGVDATIATGFYPFPTVTAAMSRGAHLIPIDGPVAAQLRREYPFVRQVTIPADTYPGQPTDIATLGVERLLIASSRLDEGLVHDLTRVFIETLPEMAASMHTSIRLTNVELASATPIPLHAGAAQYYRERELTR
ncbi:MAG: TAXI family TRAP transporter solute-binding subunit [Vicinamibacterales bacterium]